jgi:hypothetical protein
MSGMSVEDVGPSNYTAKRDWRRILEREVRGEGYDKFRPNPNSSSVDQSVPPGVDGPITLSAECILPNGSRAVIVGTKTTIWRYFGLDNGDYNDDGYAVVGYFQTEVGNWITIASGLSPNAGRWESEQVGSWLVLNNGLDLPMTYNLLDLKCKPIYELRENSIASVGTISVVDDILCCHDIREITEDSMNTIMSSINASDNAYISGVSSSLPATGTVNSGTTGVAGSILTASSAVFNDGNGFVGLEGCTVTMANGLQGVILSVTDATHCVIDSSNLSEPSQLFTISSNPSSPDAYKDYSVQPSVENLFPNNTFTLNPDAVIGLNLFWQDGTISQITGIHTDGSTHYLTVASNDPIKPQSVSIQNPSAYALFNNESGITHYGGRSIWSLPDDPRRFGATVPSWATQGQTTVHLDYPVKSLPELFGDGGSITVNGIGDQGNNLTSVIAFVYPGSANSIILSDVVQTTVLHDTSDDNHALDMLAQRADTVGSITGQFQDLDDDGGTIVQAKMLRGYLVILKDTPDIYIAQFTGNASQPFTFQRIKCTRGTQIAYPHTLESINDVFLMWASEDHFYQFDLLRQVPMPVQVLQPCENLFFEQASQSPITSVNLVPDGQTYDGSGNYSLGVLAGFDDQFIITSPSGDQTISTPLPRPILQEMSAGTLPATIGGVNTAIVLTGTAGSIVSQAVNQIYEQSAEYRIFTESSSVTKEFFICFPSQTQDKAIRYDYLYQTASSTSMDITSAASVKRPTGQSSPGDWEDWFIIGTESGVVYRYGLMSGQGRSSGSITANLDTSVSNTASSSSDFFQPSDVWKSIRTSSGSTFAVAEYVSPTQVIVIGAGKITSDTFTIINSIYHRDGQPYNSYISHGVGSFGDASSEKIIYEYVLLLSSQSADSSVAVGFIGSVNPDGSNPIRQSGVIAHPKTSNLLKPTMMSYYLGDSISTTGINNPVEITGRIFRTIPVDSHNIGRI